MALEDRPNKDNVKEGDLLVSDYFDNATILLKINKIYEEGAFAELPPLGAQYRSFKDSVILKPDGSYLVGENVTREITQRDSDYFMVVDNSCNKSILLPIARTYEGKFTEETRTPKCRCIEDTVILNIDGSCSIGEKVIRRAYKKNLNIEFLSLEILYTLWESAKD